MSYGKHFASMYSGSLFGKPATVFALWGYVIANMRPDRKDGQCYVEINAAMLAATFATTVQAIHEALEILEAPDEASRTKTEDGRRLVLLDAQRHAGPMQYRVVNGAQYRAMRDEEERRVYLRDAKRKERAQKKAGQASEDVNNVNKVNRGLPKSTQAEAEAEARNIVGRSVRVLFEERWKRYPEKEGKQKALESFVASVRNEIDLARFDRALTNYLLHLEQDRKAFGRRAKNGATFFKNWQDEKWQEPPQAKPNSSIRPEGLQGVAL